MAPLIREYTGVEDAQRLMLAHARPTGKIETVPVVKSYGRVLAENAVAPGDVPPSSTSHMDGYAVVSGDLRDVTSSHPAALRIIDTVGPSGRSKRALVSGEAIQVATGAILPVGADAVVPVESVKVEGKKVLIGTVSTPGDHVYRAGKDIRRGELVLPKGHRIRAQDVGILVTLGFRTIRVRARPKVAVIATGSELTPASRPRKGKTVESHSLVFLRIAEALGCTPVDMGIAVDDPGKLRTTLSRALATSDLVVTLGGTSAGERDLVVSAVSSLRPDVLVHGVRLDRGRVTGLAAVKGKPVLMLPGPIQAAANAFLVIGVPTIGALSGSSENGFTVPCVLGGPWEARRRFSNFQKVVYVRLKASDRSVAEPIVGETESMKLLTDADGYFVVPENVTKLEAGARVEVRLVPGFSLA